MKFLTLVTLLSLFITANLLAEVEVIFENPDKFTDIDYDYRGNKRGQKIYLPDLEKYIVRISEKYLEDGQMLTITFTDIDLAGMHEPWRSPGWDDVRIVKSIYPPRMEFRFELTGAQGNVLKSGEERLVDLGFDYRIRTNTYDDLFYDKMMFKDWVRDINKEEE